MRVANPEGVLRYAIYGTGASFAIMWIGLTVQKIHICYDYACVVSNSVAISQLISEFETFQPHDRSSRGSADILSDAMLAALPILVFRHVKLPKNRKILVLLSFSAGLFITAVTILHSALLFGPTASGIIVVGHVKVK